MRDDAAIRERAHEIRLALPPSFAVMVLRFTAEIDAKIHQRLQYLLSIPGPVKVLLQVAERQQAVLLAASAGAHSLQDEAPAFLSKLSSRLQERLGSIGVEAAGGSVYRDYRKVETSYREALSVLQIKRRFPAETIGAFLYRELGYYRYLPLLSEHNKEHPAGSECLRRPRAYDLEHGSDLLQTLSVFLSCNGNAKQAAEALHVHTNTMAYRLKRIAEIGDIDLEEMDQIVTLYLELKTQQYDGTEPL
ncbi:helix-turn-helix domain-containing protein [Paenibacillus sp. P25]|nr:helix-turn-helix domain-containing protein [Paenibacillus sp. P25]